MQVAVDFLVVGDVVLYVDQIIERIAVLIAAAVDKEEGSLTLVIGGSCELVAGAGLHGSTKLWEAVMHWWWVNG